jgi:hypothetical protein
VYPEDSGRRFLWNYTYLQAGCNCNIQSHVTSNLIHTCNWWMALCLRCTLRPAWRNVWTHLVYHSPRSFAGKTCRQGTWSLYGLQVHVLMSGIQSLLHIQRLYYITYCLTAANQKHAKTNWQRFAEYRSCKEKSDDIICNTYANIALTLKDL